MDTFTAEFNTVLERYAAQSLPTPPLDSWIVSDADLTRVESELRVRLPEKYKQFMKVFGGGVFVYLELIPPASPNSRTWDLVDLNSGDNEVPGFVCIAPDGAGNHWGFVTVDGVCMEKVSYYSFEDEEIEPAADDFLEFVSWRGLHAGREGY